MIIANVEARGVGEGENAGTRLISCGGGEKTSEQTSIGHIRFLTEGNPLEKEPF